jgi:ATP-dependent protease HslVU (ClpYQ) peptidase subunit
VAGYCHLVTIVTCVAAYAGRMASDSRDTGAIKRSCTKIFRRHGYLVGGAGASAPLNVLEFELTWPVKPTIESLTRWVYQHHDPETLDFEAIELLIATKTQVFTVEGRAAFVAPFGAIGSGAAYALGYMQAKPKDLAGAISAACQYDPYCAGPVRKMEL